MGSIPPAGTAKRKLFWFLFLFFFLKTKVKPTFLESGKFGPSLYCKQR